MRIGLIAPPWVAVPPPRYGGTEAVIDNLARGLTARGHHVVLFTVGTSTCPVERRHLYDEPATPMGQAEVEGAHALAAYESLRRDVDVIHDNTYLGPLLAASLPVVDDLGGRCVPSVLTVHMPARDAVAQVLARTTGHANLVAISQSQRRLAPELTFRRVIHHGIDLDAYRVGPGGGGYAVFVGRMSAAKGVHRAIDIARRAGVPLKVVAKMWEQVEIDYFRAEVEPRLHNGVELVLDADRERGIELVCHADAVLNPICWPEPFGLVMAEALACGTPVVGSPHGAAPEIVTDGVTGFLRESDDELVEALGRAHELDRDDCRLSAVENFSVERMARDHEDLYCELLEEAQERRWSVRRRRATAVRPLRMEREGA